MRRPLRPDSAARVVAVFAILLYRSRTTTAGDGHAAFSQEHDKRPVGVRPEPSRASEDRTGRASRTTFQLRWPGGAPQHARSQSENDAGHCVGAETLREAKRDFHKAGSGRRGNNHEGRDVACRGHCGMGLAMWVLHYVVELWWVG